MTYIQYFHKGVVTGNDIPACGDRAVVVLDGRQSLRTWKQDAVRFNGYRRPMYTAYQIMQGDSFTRSHAITGIIPL
jgi:hypothetical protein